MLKLRPFPICEILDPPLTSRSDSFKIALKGSKASGQLSQSCVLRPQNEITAKVMEFVPISTKYSVVTLC